VAQTLGGAASATGTFVRGSLAPKDTGYTGPAPTGDYDPSHITPTAPAAPGRGVETEQPPTLPEPGTTLTAPRPIWERPNYDVLPQVLAKQAQDDSLPARAARGEHLSSS